MYYRLRKCPFTVIITIIIVGVLCAYVMGKENEFSEVENRYLSTRPVFTLSSVADGSFMADFEKYTEDQMPLRSELIKLKAVCSQLLLKNENNGIVRGRDGYLFEKKTSVDKGLDKNIAAVKNFVKNTDRDVNVCIIPNSMEIYKEKKVPRGAFTISQRDIIGNFYRELSAYENVHTIDLFDELKDHSSEYIYYRTDHHWTTLGAYYAYLVLLDEMGLKVININDFEKESIGDFYGTYYSKYKGVGIKPDAITVYNIPVDSYVAGGVKHEGLYDYDKAEQYDKYALFMYGNEGLCRVESAFDSDDMKESLVIFKDSYANSIIPFLSCVYKDIIIVDLRYYNDSVKGLLDENPDADILIMNNFMHLNEDNHFYRLTT